MKKRIQGLSFILILALIVTLATLILRLPYGWSVSAATVSLCAGLLLLQTWMLYVKKLLIKSNTALNKPPKASAWSFDNMALLKENQEETHKKFSVSAELITNLTHPEKIVATAGVDFSDPIGKALLLIKSEMQKIKEEDEKRAWVTQGQADFGEVLRNKVEVHEYGNNIMLYLVRYLKANQGKFFIEYEDENGDPYLELIACYAYDRRKHLSEKVYAGQGALGQNMLEHDFVFITDVPDSYVKITSGLGEATPRNLVIAPLIFNETYCGAIELALFNVMEPHHIEFLKKVCENIASEIMALKTMRRTEDLLGASRTLTDELQSRESQMKKNLDDLAASQAEIALKQTELSGVINAIDSTLGTAEFNATGRLLKHNMILEKFTGLTPENLAHKDYSLITGQREETLWRKIWNGEIRSGDYKTQSASRGELWLSVTFTPITDASLNPVKLLCMIQDITQKKVKEIEFERLSIVANNTDNSVIITDKLGYIEYVNSGFTKMTGFRADEVTGQKPGKLLQGPLTDKKTIEKLSRHVAGGIPIYEEILNYSKTGDTYWVSLAINPVRNSEGEIVQYISIQADITQTKIKAMDFNQKLEALSRSNAILEIDPRGIVIDINDNYLNILGYSRNEVLGKSYSLLTQKDNVFSKLIDTVKDQGIQSGVYSRYSKTGQLHFMKLLDYPVLNLNGELEKIIEFGTDVSNERRLEKEAERREAELKSYLHGIDNTIASAEFSLAGDLLQANEIFLKVMGYAREDFVETGFKYLLGEDAATVMMWENLRLGKFFSGEFKMKNKAGKELWLNGTFNPIFVEGDTPEKIMMFAQFTTQEKEKVNDLNGMVNALKSTLPVLEFNQQFTCKTANEKAMKIFGFSRMDLRSKTIEDFIAPHYRHLWQKYKDEILRTDVANFYIPFQAGERIVTYEVSLSVIRTLEGEIGKIIVLLVKEATDIDKVSALKVV
ncbi:PAS domain S-box protein [Chryseolinea lacunae]|uniref:PAS domain S-box protein n=1 Tax=Chryseolinea lacunae TaxID=2801331 RepID=A0ABS1KP54_9BACT|nr:PAS domain S-box protein [Chryseolinea lacunae]MBL0741098.1 PAS domain S-box protein [Chryseolinea lacunae]